MPKLYAVACWCYRCKQHVHRDKVIIDVVDGKKDVFCPHCRNNTISEVE